VRQTLLVHAKCEDSGQKYARTLSKHKYKLLCQHTREAGRLFIFIFIYFLLRISNYFDFSALNLTTPAFYNTYKIYLSYDLYLYFSNDSYDIFPNWTELVADTVGLQGVFTLDFVPISFANLVLYGRN
jgi:hypothetical protein